MVRRDTNSVEFIYCECGCGFTKSKYDKNGRICRFLIGHSYKGKHFTEEHRKRIGDAQRGEKNHRWKGDNVGYSAVHYRMDKILPKPKDGLCELCHQKPIKEKACLTGNWKDESLNNWAWLCKKCHNECDNIGIRSYITRKKNNIIYERDPKTGRFLKKD